MQVTTPSKLGRERERRGAPEAAGLPGLGDLPAVPNAGDAGEVFVGEDGIIVGEQRGSLPLRERGREQRGGPVRPAVEAEADACGACVVGVLDELPQRRGALRVVGKHLADAPREVDALAEVLEEHPAQIHGGEAHRSIEATGPSWKRGEERKLGFGREDFDDKGGWEILIRRFGRVRASAVPGAEVVEEVGLSDGDLTLPGFLPCLAWLCFVFLGGEARKRLREPGSE